MSPHLSPDTKAIVRAAEAMTEQVRRIADHLAAGARQDVFDLAPPEPDGQAPRLLACGLCYEEQGEEVHPHPECPIGSTSSVLREQIADAIGSTNLPAWPRSYRLEAADAVLAVILPTTKLLGELARSADADIKRVISLYDQWVKGGPPPLGTSVSRWWDERLYELHAAILPHADAPADQPKEQ